MSLNGIKNGSKNYSYSAAITYLNREINKNAKLKDLIVKLPGKDKITKDVVEEIYDVLGEKAPHILGNEKVKQALNRLEEQVDINQRPLPMKYDTARIYIRKIVKVSIPNASVITMADVQRIRDAVFEASPSDDSDYKIESALAILEQQARENLNPNLTYEKFKSAVSIVQYKTKSTALNAMTMDDALTVIEQFIKENFDEDRFNLFCSTYVSAKTQKLSIQKLSTDLVKKSSLFYTLASDLEDRYVTG